MTQLLGPDGKPISSDFLNKKAPPPKLGEAFGSWSGRDLQLTQLPGGGIVQFDLSKLTLADFRSMRDHYQVNASLAVLSFMQHQSDWHIECEDQRIADHCEEQLKAIWTPLNRSMSTANWSGYSPNVLDWENDMQTRSVRINKVKDMTPEECSVNWKEVNGWAPPNRVPPKFKVYDGINIFGTGWPVPVENTFWYPLLMENGDHYGQKLLRPAFTSWFFSILVHLFANRYYERFGEPTPIGRAPFDEEITPNGEGSESVQGNIYMLKVLQNLRSRGAVVLPNDKSQVGDSTTSTQFDYDVEYLESQMRGADFERYMTRLDEEISIGLFTPILLMRTADVGSYNLGVGHMQMYLWMLNAMNDDRKQYIDKYLLRKMVNYNFSENAPSAKIKFRKMGNTNAELLKELLVTLVNKGDASVDLRELGQMAGMTLHEVEQTLKEGEEEEEEEDDDSSDGERQGATPPAGRTRSAPAMTETYATATEIYQRVQPQVEKAFREGTFGTGLQINMGYKRKFEKALDAHGVQNSISKTNRFYDCMDAWISDVVALGPDEFSGPASFMSLFRKVMHNQISELASAD